MRRWWRREVEPPYVDVGDHFRRRAIREAEYQAAADAGSKVLRVSGKVPAPARRIPCVIVMDRRL